MKKKIISVVGARPNFMKIAPIDRAFKLHDSLIDHYIVHTGQHYDEKMSDAFFKDLEMPEPKYFLGVGSGSHAVQTAKIMIEFEKILINEKPDLVIVAGDVNSTLACSITAVKLHIPVAHIEGGLRSGDREMPEEINRIVTDSISNYCFITELSGKINLMKENFPTENIFFVGNTMIDSQLYALPRALKSNILKDLNLIPNQYILTTLHRPSNVDEKDQLKEMLETLVDLSMHSTIVFPIHPRTSARIKEYGFENIILNQDIKFIDPLGYLDFLALMMNSKLVLTDSGGIHEETTALQIPCITLRTSTERPITIEIGTNVLVLPIKDRIINAVEKVLANSFKKGQIPQLWDGDAANRIVEIIINKILN